MGNAKARTDRQIERLLAVLKELYLSAKNPPGFQIRKIRPGKYAKIIDGEVIGIATKRDVITINNKDVKPNIVVDVGLVEVSLAIAALFAFFITQEYALLVRIFAIVVFFLSSIAAGVFYWTIMYSKIPFTANMVNLYGGFWRPKGFIWLAFRWSIVTKDLLSEQTLTESTEAAYLNLLAAFFLAWITIIIWIFSLSVRLL